MVKIIILNETTIHVDYFKEETVNGFHQMIVDFKVSSEEYHDLTTLLYKGTFDVNVPEKEFAFTGTIQEYSTSVTNLYEKGQVGHFHLSLIEVTK